MCNYWYDFKIFLKSSTLLNECERENQSSKLVLLYHAIEKGLSLPQPRKNFGQERIIELLDRLKTYRLAYGDDDVVESSLSALFAYLDHSSEGGVCDRVRDYLLSENTLNAQSAGVLDVKREEILKDSMINFEDFCRSRYSIRNFTPETVDSGLIEKAVGIAQKTPSVCNRQTSRVHILRGAKKGRILEIQMGSRGFGECIDVVLVMTSDRRAFTTVGERNQCWVDSGMFAMSVIYALHSLGLGTCCLNWSLTSDRDQQARQVFSIDDSEAISMIIAVGHIPETLKVAASPRLPVAEVMREHE